jgi:hypothetical protein
MEKLLQAIKNNIKSYNQGLTKSLEIINELVVKYRKGEVDDE